MNLMICHLFIIFTGHEAGRDWNSLPDTVFPATYNLQLDPRPTFTDTFNSKIFYKILDIF